jgi:hypothetical protein
LERLGQIGGEATPLDQSDIDVAPFDVEKSLSDCRMLQAIDDLDELVSLDCRLADRIAEEED